MIIKIIEDILSTQDPEQPHTYVTRLLVSGIIVFVNLVLYGFYGVMSAVLVYLGVSWFELNREWALIPLVVALIIGLWKGGLALSDYWKNYGH